MIENIYPPKLPDWLSSGGDDFEVVIASEACYFRNIADKAFPNRLDEMELKNFRRSLISGVEKPLRGLKLWETDTHRAEDRRFLVERFSAPKELIDYPHGTALFLSEDESKWLSMNVIDHLRFRIAVGGADIETAYRRARSMEEEFEEELPFAYSERYGFLTARPTDCGTGLLLKFLVHIPGVIFTDGFLNLRDKLQKSGTILRPLPDESMSAEGHVFIVHTAHSLGNDEEELLAGAQEVIDEIIEMEYDARAEIMSKARGQIENKILRGIGVITHARMIAKEEGFALSSALRLGAIESIITDIDALSATELYFVNQPVHLARLVGEGDEFIENTNRAELFRSYLQGGD